MCKVDGRAGGAGRRNGEHGGAGRGAAGISARLRLERIRSDTHRDHAQYRQCRSELLVAFWLYMELSLDSNAFAQPLYVPNVVIPGLGTHNVLYVATMNDSIYAFDADVGGAPLWTVNLASDLSTTAVLWANFNFPPVSNSGNLGILSTPVIDPSTHIMYVVACTLENRTMAYRLHAVAITSTARSPMAPAC